MLVITDDSPRSELEEAIGHLRAKQRAVFDPQVKAELQASIDELLDMLGQSRNPEGAW